MTDDIFLAALQKVTAGGLTLAELIHAASGLTEAGLSRSAQQLYAVWINFNPEHPQLYVAHFNKAALEAQVGELAAARQALESALAINPDFIPAYINLGGVLERTGSPDQALEQWKAAVTRLAGANAGAVRYKLTALQQIARVFSDHKQLECAESALQDAVSLDLGRRDLLEQYLALRLGQCKWPVLTPWEGASREALLGGMHPLSLAAYTDDPLLQLAAAARYVAQSVDEDPAALRVDRRDAPINLAGRRLRIGYVSSDLRDHAVGYLMAELLELHDRQEVEVFAYYCGTPSTDPLNGRLRAAVEHWADIYGLSDDAAAELIAKDGIDILVDVNGHTRDGRTGVFARRPAPVQVNWLGYPGTMGSPYHHYLVTDDWIVPPGSEHYYSEKVVRLPCYQPSDRKRAVAAPPTRREVGLPEQAVVFCCFNAPQKITRFTFERWMQILKRVPDSVLWLLEGAAGVQERLHDFAELHGVARQRVIFAPRQPNAQHLARHALADLFLDTVPYGAHTTASDALWMGTPVLTLSGRSFASRVCGSLVRAAGLADLVSLSPEAYVERAVALGLDRPELEAHRARLQAGRNSCALFDMETLVSRLEALYREMAEDHRRGRTPRPDLTNLDRYFEAGIAIDHEAQEVLAVEDYDAWFKARLALRHRMRPLAADERLWTREDIIGGEAETETRPGRRSPRLQRAAAG